jgi:hypothetical protein
MLRRLFQLSFVILYSLVLSGVFSFLLIELFPGILNAISLDHIRYYALKREYVDDPDLVFVYRKKNYVLRSRFSGDLSSPEDGISTQSIDYVATFNELGFRKNSSVPPYDIAVIGDSFIEFGENDESTFTELLRHETDLRILNLGRGWYGPYQYLEVLKRYAIPEKPRYVIFCFFAGNDFNDIAQYQLWRASGKYYFYRDLHDQNIASRLFFATSDVWGYLTRRIKQASAKESTRRDPSTFGIIEVRNKQVSMVFPHWEKEITTEQAQELRMILREFKSLASRNHFVPILVYIPTANQVYADFYSSKSNYQFINRVRSTPDNPSLRSIEGLAGELDLDFINLLPVFKRRAAEGQLIYYPFDTHWNVEGRRTAASFIAAYLGNKFGIGP